MKKYLLLFLALAFAGRAQDTLMLKSREKMIAIVLLIEKDSIRYKPMTNLSGPDFYVRSLNVHMVKYKNGSVVNVDSLYTQNNYTGSCAISGTPDELFEKGKADAKAYFTGNCGSYLLAGAGVVVAFAAIVPAFIVMAVPPMKSNLNYPCEELWQDEDYREGYKKKAWQLKRQKIWKISIPTIVVSSIIWAKIAEGLR